MKKLFRGIFKLITVVAVVLWVLSAAALDSPDTMIPTMVCFICSAWIVFAVLVSKPE